MKTELKIEGMSCGHCVASVRSALESVAGVEKAEVDLAAGKATVEHQPGTTAQALTEAVEEEGYRARTA
jgi:copper chaperone CopZ